MKRLLLSGIAALFLATGAAHAREWQGNMPKPIGKLPSYPPIVCVTPNWTPEPCESRKSSAHADAWGDVGEAIGKLFDFLDMLDRSWLGTALKNYDHDPKSWNGAWPPYSYRNYRTLQPKSSTVLFVERGGVISTASSAPAGPCSIS